VTGREIVKNGWFTYLRSGLSRRLAEDPLAGQSRPVGLRSGLGNLRPFVARHWRSGLVGIVFVALTTLLAFPQPLIMRFIVDEAILGRQLHLLIVALFLVVVVAAAERLVRFVEEFYFARFEQEVILDIQEDVLARALRLPKAFFDENQTGYLMARLASDVQGLRWFFSSTVVHLISNLFRFSGGLGLLFYLEWRLAATVLIILPGLVLSMHYLSRRVHALSHRTREEQALVASDFQESLASIPLVKAFTSEARTVNRLMSRLKGALHVSLEQSAVNALATLAAGSLPGLGRAMVLAFGAYWVITDQWTLGSLLAFQVYLGYVFGPAQFLAETNLQVQGARAALERVSALYDMVPEENLGTGAQVERLRGEIEFRNVSFAYGGREPVLEGISFRIHPGEHVAITAASGVGKTTLLSLILRFYRPTAGELFFDGRPASDYDLISLRRRIGYVAQSPCLLSGTILENLRYGNPEASVADVLRAARVAEIHDFIVSLPAGYGSRLGEGGVNLSQGEKQRLAVARALVRDPDILVLDEPTSALDGQTEESLLHSLPPILRNRTLVVATHRLPTIMDADRVLLLDRSRLIATGTHRSLWTTNDAYRTLVVSPYRESIQ
jgi:ABC-type multidrug transport system fused ATPase/permease subunit